jgi:hypothetical protein
MNIRYVSPPKPIDLTVKGGLSNLVNPADFTAATNNSNVPHARSDAANHRRDSLDALSDSTTMDHAAEDVAAMFDTQLPPRRFEV